VDLPVSAAVSVLNRRVGVAFARKVQVPNSKPRIEPAMSEISTHGQQPGHGEHEHDAHGHDDHGGLMKYIYVFIALCLLTSMSFLTYTDFWRNHFDVRAGWFLMMAVSCSKAMLVILFFMHIKYEANWKYVLTIPASFMSLFLVLMLVPDVGFRTVHYSRERLESAAPRELFPQSSTHGGAHHGYRLPYSKADLEQLEERYEHADEKEHPPGHK
jgi:cytochrome c oxidase subunit 4